MTKETSLKDSACEKCGNIFPLFLYEGKLLCGYCMGLEQLTEQLRGDGVRII